VKSVANFNYSVTCVFSVEVLVVISGEPFL